jgi:lipoate-protein ligase A
MDFHILPTRTGGAAENMALDFLMLQRYPAADAVRFRHYEWRGVAFTFGFGQKIAWVREQLRGHAEVSADQVREERVDLCRRPTGGGIVDHRRDWTYALVIPRAHAWWDARATESYRAVHESLAQALGEIGCPSLVKMQADAGGTAAPAGVCFQRAELFDVVHQHTGAKIAGAAQKRNKHGLLFQGSVWKPAAGEARDWDRFGDRFVAALAQAAGVPAISVPWPDFNEDEVAALIEQYSSPEWLEYR